jgi:hypothetical protein
MRAVFLRALYSPDKASAIMAGLVATSNGEVAGRFEVDPASFSAIPRSPFAYWITEPLRSAFVNYPRVETKLRRVKVGVQTFDDFRFLRLAWEHGMHPEAAQYFPFAKGGAYSLHYADLHLDIEFSHAGRAVSVFKYQHRPREGAAHRGVEYYGRPGLTWPRRTNGLSIRVLPRACIFAEKGPSVFREDDDLMGLLALSALMSSRAVALLVALQTARVSLAQSYEVGLIQSTPMPDLVPADETTLAALARRAWTLKRNLDTRTETSHAFTLPALLQVPGDTLAACAAAWAARVRATEDELAAIQAEIDERCYALYGISHEDRRSINEGFGGSTADTDEDAADEAGADDEEEAEADTADTATLVAELVSWAVGVAFGRFDVRLATGARDLPGEPEPFDPLPVCSPGMLTGADGLPLDAPPAGYPLSFPSDGILVDDPGHPRDLATAVRAVFEIVFGSRADAAWQEAGDLLDPRTRDVVAWLRSGFFEHHLRRHSKSRRKAPIVWQLGSGRSGIFAYAHRLTRDSLFAIGNDIAAPRLAVDERRLASLRTGAGVSPSARDRAEIDAAETAVEEARFVLAEIRRVAPLWNPDLDDGIVLVSAPLWRLAPHTAWQKELKGRWDDLVAGKYDWAHLAMHLWPERVVPKCAPDRSLAIAHGLDDVFWAEGADGKWARRGRPARPVEELVGERTSPAVKAALVDLQGAPVPASGSGRGRGRG